MATIFPPFRSLAPRTALQWSANNVPLGGAVIDGFAANFAGIVGGEQVTIGRFGSPLTLITMLPGDTSAALVAARINATFPGLASVNANGGVRLRNGTSVQVTTISGVDQTKLGLPAALVRDASLGLQPTVRPDLTTIRDRIDMISAPVSIPDGANRIAIWLKLVGNDATDVGCRFIVGFTNGVEGGITNNLLNQGVSLDLVPVVEDDQQRIIAPALTQLYVPALGPGLEFNLPFEVDVPPGAVGVYVTALTAESPDGTRGYSPPTISGGVIPGVR